MRAAGDRRLKLERSLPRALQTGGLTLCYQPIVMTESGRPVGFEALMRWEHPTLGIIPPVEFIPVAESTRIIGDLTFWVIEQSLWNLVDWTARWPYAIPPYVSINVSRKQIGDALFLDQLRTLLRYTKLVPGELVVEITETMSLGDPVETRDFLRELRGMGLKIALDDFGTGYSSLRSLHELPVHMLKIEPEFVAAAQNEARAFRAVDGLVRMAHALGLEVVAEGVEELPQRQLVTQVRCDLMQGYLISPPLEAPSTGPWLERHLPNLAHDTPAAPISVTA